MSSLLTNPRPLTTPLNSIPFPLGIKEIENIPNSIDDIHTITVPSIHSITTLFMSHYGYYKNSKKKGT